MHDRRVGTGWMVAGVVGLLAAAASGCGRPSPGIAVGAIEFQAAPGSLAPRLAVDGERVVLSWLEREAGGGHAFRIAVRGAGGWEQPRTVIRSDSIWANWADLPSVLPLPDGTWYAQWPHRVGPGTYAYHVRVSRSLDTGRTWAPSFPPHGDRSETEHGFVSLIPWGDGAAAIWLDGRRTVADGPMTLRFTTLTAAGDVAPDVEVDDQVCDCCQTALARTTGGLVAAYRDRAEGEIRDIVVRRYVDGAWSEARPVADDGWHYPGCPVNGPAIAARGDTVVVAWFTAAGDTPRVYAAFSTDGGASFGARRQVDDGRPAGRVDVVWWADEALVAWIEETDDAGDIRVRAMVPSGAERGSTIVRATSASRAAGFPRLAVAGDAVVVAWTEPGDGGGVRAATLARRP